MNIKEQTIAHIGLVRADGFRHCQKYPGHRLPLRGLQPLD
jgi:hypothetical protein